MTNTNLKTEVIRILGGRDMTEAETRIFNSLRRDQPGLVNAIDIVRILRHRTGNGPVGFMAGNL
jgi:hypothetical protein